MNWITAKVRFILLILLFLAFLSGCGIYSFSGIAIDYNKIKTISIQRFYDEANGGPPNLAQLFTENLRDYYQQNTQLTLESSSGDLQLSGSITGYNFSPVAPVSSGSPTEADVAGLQRLTIRVQVNYVNLIEPETSFEKSFSFYDDYNPDTQELSAVEDELIETINEQIIYDIFNATVANW
jgi:uncharacterized Zn-finger protein